MIPRDEKGTMAMTKSKIYARKDGYFLTTIPKRITKLLGATGGEILLWEIIHSSDGEMLRVVIRKESKNKEEQKPKNELRKLGREL